MLNIQKDQTIVIVGSRYNPQLGTYLTGPYIGKVKRLNKLSFSVDLGKDGDYVPTTFDFSGWARRDTRCIYGAMSYRAYTAADAIDLLSKEIGRYDPQCFKVTLLRKAIDKLRAL